MYWFSVWHHHPRYVDLSLSAVCGVGAAGARAGFDSHAVPGPPQLRHHGQLPEFKPRRGGGRAGWGRPRPDPWDWTPRPPRPLLLQPRHGQPRRLPVTLNPRADCTCPSGCEMLQRCISVASDHTELDEEPEKETMQDPRKHRHKYIDVSWTCLVDRNTDLSGRYIP